MIAPDGTPIAGGLVTRHIDNAMVKAIARAFRWREMLENGEYPTIREIADAEKINETYVSRILRITLLAPDIVESAMNGRQWTAPRLSRLMKQFPLEWKAQRSVLLSAKSQVRTS